MSEIEHSGKVLILGNDFKNYRSCLTIIRSLGRRGLKVHVGWCLDDVALGSKYVARVHHIPPFSVDDDSWKSQLIAIVRQEKFDLVVAGNEQASAPLEAHRQDLEPLGCIYFLNKRAHEIAFDKFKSSKLAGSLGIKLPKEKRISDISQMDTILSEYDFPIVLKPKVSFRIENLRTKNYVYKAYNSGQLRSCLGHLLQSGDVLIQENFIGVGVGIEFLADHGELLSAFQHVRVHEPLMGGGSSYRKSAPLHPELIDATKRLLKSLDYTGVGMVEFKVNFKTGDWIFLEINGRFWGSLPLAVAAGVDFPYYLYQFFVEQKRKFPDTYTTGLYCRNTIRDFEWILQNLLADKSEPSRNTLPNWQVAKEFVNILTFRERNDTWAIDDIKPALIELKHLTIMLVNKTRSAISSYSPLRWFGTFRLRRALKKAESILFVCFGNIYRSPFACYYAQTVLPESVKISSCGCLPKGGRPCHQKAVDIASEFGVDMGRHRSQVITEKTVQQADIVLTFDRQNMQTLNAEYPSARGKTHYLALLSYRGALVIDDPIEGNIYTVRRTFKAIADAIDSYVAYLKPKNKQTPETG